MFNVERERAGSKGGSVQASDKKVLWATTWLHEPTGRAGGSRSAGCQTCRDGENYADQRFQEIPESPS
jgi:hypothetical protein